MSSTRHWAVITHRDQAHSHEAAIRALIGGAHGVLFERHDAHMTAVCLVDAASRIQREQPNLQVGIVAGADRAGDTLALATTHGIRVIRCRQASFDALRSTHELERTDRVFVDIPGDRYSAALAQRLPARVTPCLIGPAAARHAWPIIPLNVALALASGDPLPRSAIPASACLSDLLRPIDAFRAPFERMAI